MPHQPSDIRQQIMKLADMIEQALAEAEARLHRLFRSQEKIRHEDIVFFQRIGKLTRAQYKLAYEFFGLAKRMREGLEGDNQRLRAALESLQKKAQEQINALIQELEKLSLSPLSYGVLRSLNEDGTATVAIGGREYEVNVASAVNKNILEAGRKILLNEKFHIVGVAEFETRGEEVTVKNMLSDARVVIAMRADEIRIAELAASLRGATLKNGDKVLLNAAGYVSERLPKGEIEDLLLEEVPDISYGKIGGLGPQIEQIRDAIELPHLYAEHFLEHKLLPPKGVLLYGPPGCGKTLIAKAIAHSLAEQISEKTGQSVKGCFLNIKGPELLNKYVGETERKIREIFSRAREKAAEGSPVVVFFDEMDSLFRTRGSGISSDMESTIVPQFLAELDGVEGLKNVVVIGASNRQDLIDPAVLRPGRFDVKIKIDRPDFAGTHEIFKIYCTPDLPIFLEPYQKTEQEFVREDGTKVAFRLYDESGNYTPRDRFGNPRKFYDCDTSLAQNERNERDLKQMKFVIGRDEQGNPRSEDMVAYFIKRAVIELWGMTPESQVWSQFVEITYASGGQETMFFRHFMSGAIIESIMTRVKKAAVKRLIQTGKRGIVYSDFFNAIQDEYRENEELPNTTNPDDWTKIVAQRGERIVNVRRTKKEKETNKKRVETVSTGHYL